MSGSRSGWWAFSTDGRRASEAPVEHPAVRVLTLGGRWERREGPFKPGRRFRTRPLFPGVPGGGGGGAAGRPRAEAAVDG